MEEVAKAAAVVTGAALVMLLPSFVQGSPFFFWDTAEYLRFGHIIANGWHDDGPSWRWLTIMGGRSPFYSVALWQAVALGGIWLPVLLQALCASYLLRTSLIAFRAAASPLMLLGLALWLGLTSSFGVYVGFLMPDVFAGLALLSLMALLVATALTRGQILATTILGVFAVLAHNTNVVIGFLAVVLVVAARWMDGRRGAASLRRAFLPMAILVTATCLSIVATGVIGAKAGGRLVAPPYLMARVLADGPGRTLLTKACDPPRFEICAFRAKPLDQHNPILWSTELHNSVYATAGQTQRMRLSDEQIRFVVAAVLADPIRQLFMILRNSAAQLRHFETSAQAGQARASWDGMVSQWLPGARGTIERSAAYTQRMPWRAVDAVHGAVVLLSLGFVLWRLTRADARLALHRPFDQRDADQRFLAGAIMIAAVLIATLLTNALLCGAASGVSARYQARLIWLLPLLAAVLWRQTRGGARSIVGSGSRTSFALR